MPIEIKIVPKEFREGLKARLYINEEIMEMKSNGSIFSATAEVGIFNNSSIRLELDQGGVKKLNLWMVLN